MDSGGKPVLAWMTWSFFSCIECTNESIKRIIHIWVSGDFFSHSIFLGLFLIILISLLKYPICSHVVHFFWLVWSPYLIVPIPSTFCLHFCWLYISWQWVFWLLVLSVSWFSNECWTLLVEQYYFLVSRVHTWQLTRVANVKAWINLIRSLSWTSALLLWQLLSWHHRCQIPLAGGRYFLVLSMGARVPESFSQCSCFNLGFQLSLYAYGTGGSLSPHSIRLGLWWRVSVVPVQSQS